MGQPAPRVLPEEPEPAWDVARPFPPQGSWGRGPDPGKRSFVASRDYPSPSSTSAQ
jgi:hypothetical protein